MPHYRCYRVGDTDRYRAVEELEAESDELAIARARQLLVERPHKAAFELWELARQAPATSRVRGRKDANQ